jgi:hypothetical protein
MCMLENRWLDLDGKLGPFTIGVLERNDLFLKDYKWKLWIFVYFTIL